MIAAILACSADQEQRDWLYQNAAFLPAYLRTLEGREFLALLIENFKTYLGDVDNG